MQYVPIRSLLSFINHHDKRTDTPHDATGEKIQARNDPTIRWLGGGGMHAVALLDDGRPLLCLQVYCIDVSYSISIVVYPFIL